MTDGARFICLCCFAWLVLQVGVVAEEETQSTLSHRVEGLVLGAAIGDAMGGPIEFQSREALRALDHPPKVWKEGETLNEEQQKAARERLRLRSYRELRPDPASYGMWNRNSLPGTITDDTRHKVVLFYALKENEEDGRWPFTVKDLAQAYLDWPDTLAATGKAGYKQLTADWLEEWQFGARWVLGERDLDLALPPERMWQSLPTCCGQMSLLPVAGLFAGQPVEAYQATFQLSFFDNGFGKDLNAALVAGLAQALVTPSGEGVGLRRAWQTIHHAMRRTDPYRFGKIRWTTRSVDLWLDLALKLAREAEGQPARLFSSLEKEFNRTIKWEAQVPFVVAFACLELAEYDPLIALQLSMEWGHDTDSYAQLVGAFLGALHGRGLFPQEWREAVINRLQEDHGVDLLQEANRLLRLQLLGGKRKLIALPNSE